MALVSCLQGFEERFIALLKQGCVFKRISNWGKHSYDAVRVSDDMTEVFWGKKSQMAKDIVDIILGREGSAFGRYDAKHFKDKMDSPEWKQQERCSFSVKFRTRFRLDLVASSYNQREQWVNALGWLKILMVKAQSGMPFNFQHRTHVNTEFKWKGNLEEVFEITRKLGKGAFGEVFLAVHKNSRFEVAIKMLEVLDEEVQNDIKHEIKMLKQCQHSGIVTYYGCWGPDSQNRLWILMDYCAVGSVRKLAHQVQSLSEKQIAYICASTLRALVYLHANRIVHRDIKGENLMLMENGDVKLADFGVSRHLPYIENTEKRKEKEKDGHKLHGDDGKNSQSDIAGTPLWMAPEVLEGGGSYKADIWGLGITAIEMSEQPIPHCYIPIVLHLLQAIYLSPPPKLEGDQWSDNFKDFVSKCLTKNADDRPDAMELLSHPFVSEAEDPKVILDVVNESLLAERSKYERKKKRSSFFGKGSKSVSMFTNTTGNSKTKSSEQSHSRPISEAQDRIPEGSGGEEKKPLPPELDIDSPTAIGSFEEPEHPTTDFHESIQQVIPSFRGVVVRKESFTYTYYWANSPDSNKSLFDRKMSSLSDLDEYSSRHNPNDDDSDLEMDQQEPNGEKLQEPTGPSQDLPDEQKEDLKSDGSGPTISERIRADENHVHKKGKKQKAPAEIDDPLIQRQRKLCCTCVIL